MNTQPDLFGLKVNTDPKQIFPKFELERPNCDYSGRPKLSEMPTILHRLGFKVGQMRYHTSEVLAFPVGKCTEAATLFEVEYPDGWVLTENLASTIYIGDDNPVRQIIDSQGHLRGIVHCGWDMIPLSATLYTRYSVWDGVPLNFAKVDFDRDEVQSVVVDRTKIDPQHPNKLVDVVHVDRRWLLSERYPEIRGMPTEKHSVWIAEHVPSQSLPIGVSGSTLWLDEHFPEWRHPFAYWPH